MMRDVGTESELSSTLLSANGVLCAAITLHDTPGKGPVPIATRNQNSVVCDIRPLAENQTHRHSDRRGRDASVRGCRGPTLAGQSVCLLRIRLVARLSYTGPFPACLLAFHSRFYAVRVDPSERSTLTRAFALPQWGRPRP